jgi:hypothetical protein
MDHQVEARPERVRDPDGWPEWDVGLPAFVLDEVAETFWWDTANYSYSPRPEYPKDGPRLRYCCVRTLPGFPTFSRDHPIGPPR